MPRPWSTLVATSSMLVHGEELQHMGRGKTKADGAGWVKPAIHHSWREGIREEPVQSLLTLLDNKGCQVPGAAICPESRKSCPYPSEPYRRCQALGGQRPWGHSVSRERSKESL